MENFSTGSSAATQQGQPVGRSTGNAIVDAVTQLHFEGNIVDHRWFLAPELRHKSGLVNATAIHVLADIVYWHTAIIEKDHVTQVLLEARTRFHGKEFWQVYAVWAKALGYTERQIRDAVAFLHAAKIIKRRSGQIRLASGVKTNNVAIITLNVEKLKEITYGTPSPRRTKREAPHVLTGGAQHQNVRRPTPEREITNRDYTETTLDTSSTTHDDDVFSQLLTVGVNKSRAATLAANHPDEMRRRLSFLPYIQNIKSPGALISARPDEPWSEPPGYRDAQTAQAQTTARLQQEATNADKTRQKAKEREDKAAENQMLDDKFGALREDEQHEIQHEANDRVARLKASGFNVRGALAAARRNIMRRELGLPMEDLHND
jgi:hypothetical protein